MDPGKLASEKLVDLDVNVIKNTIGHANAYRYSKSYLSNPEHSDLVHMAHDTRNPVFGGLLTTKAQTSLRISAV